MEYHQVTPEWIARQRVCTHKVVEMIDSLVAGDYTPTIEFVDYAQGVSDGTDAALDALEAAYAEIARLIAERDGENKRADAVPEIDLRPLQPGYMGVCMTDEEDGIQLRRVSHKHPQGRGFLDDDEVVKDVAIIRFSEALQVMAVADRLTILAETMAGKVRQCAENALEAEHKECSK